MYKTDFEKTVKEAIKADKIGLPVALRLNLQLVDSSENLESVQQWCYQLAETLFQSKVKSNSSNEKKTVQQFSSIATFQNGATLSCTIGFLNSGISQLQFLLIGQKGIIQSEGLENVIWN